MSQQIGELAAIATALLWTLSTLAWTSAGRHIGAVSVAFIRLAIAVILLMLYGQLVRGLALPTDASAQTWLVLGLSGVMGFFVSDLCLFKSLLLIGPRLSLLVLSLTPPLAALISAIFLAEGLSGRHWWAMGITLAGIVWVLLEQPASERLPHERRQLWQGVLLSLVAAIAQAIGHVLSRKGIGDYDAAAATLIRILPAMAGYVLLLTVLRRWRPIAAAARQGRIMAIMTFGAVVGPFLGVILYMVALRNCHVGVVATIISTMPVIILPFSILLYREKVSLRAAGGALLSVAGVALLVW
ncbi:MAG: DMT family transporter [Thermoguttaceae bacterium]|jgi:drug/metabolite transporter (DMT)-like permease